MSGKKPVWVDEDAHAILKQFSKLTKKSMVEVASALVLEKLSQLDPATGLDAGSTETTQATATKTNVQKPVAVNAPAAKKKRKTRTNLPDPNAKDVRFVGGVWLV